MQREQISCNSPQDLVILFNDEGRRQYDKDHIMHRRNIVREQSRCCWKTLHDRNLLTTDYVLVSADQLLLRAKRREHIRYGKTH